MKIVVWARPNAKNERVEKISDREYRVWIKAPPREGKANAALIAALARYFNRPKQAIILRQGASSRKKVIEVLL